MTTIYHYSHINNEFTGQSEAANDPIDGLPLVPALATLIAPIVAGVNQVAKFEGSAWSLVADFRGWVGFDLAGTAQEITTLGVAPDPVWVTTRPFMLVEAQEIKRGEIRAAFALAAALPVTDSNGDSWSGGFDSALKMDAAKRMAELAELTTVALFDAANIEHVLTIIEAEVVVLTIGVDYQIKFSHKQALMVAADAATDEPSLDVISVVF